MSNDDLKKSFEKAADNLGTLKEQELKHIRDKDNVDPKLKPDFAKRPASNLAPPGHMGIKRGLPSNSTHRPFKPIVPRSPDKDPDIER
jgi:hypothetical protein